MHDEVLFVAVPYRMDEAGPKGSSGGPAGILGFRDYKDIDTLSAQLIGNLVVDERRDAPKHVLTPQPIFAHFPRVDFRTFEAVTGPS